MIVSFNRIINNKAREYRKTVFEKSGKKCRNIKNKGKTYVMNRNVIIGDYLTICPGAQYFADEIITIGNHISLDNEMIIYASKDSGVAIGNDVSVEAYSYIIDADYGASMDRLIRENKLETGKEIIEDDVRLASKVTGPKGNHIRKGAVCGSKMLVKVKSE